MAGRHYREHDAKLEIPARGPLQQLSITGRVILADGAKFYPRLVISERERRIARGTASRCCRRWFGAKTSLGERRLDFELAAVTLRHGNAAGSQLDVALRISVQRASRKW